MAEGLGKYILNNDDEDVSQGTHLILSECSL